MAILTAVLATALFMIAAIVVDLGVARDTRRQSQNAADAASLAAVNVLYGNGTIPQFDKAVQAAKAFAARNFAVTEAEWASCDDAHPLRYTPATTSCVSFQHSTDATRDQSRPDTVRVKLPVRDVPTSLGTLAGVASIPVGSDSVAALKFSAVPKCALCVLGTSQHDLQNGDVLVEGGDVHFNGSVKASPNGSVVTDRRTTVEATASGGTFLPAAVTSQPMVADPLAFMPMPSTAGLVLRSDPCTQGPGLYGSYSFSNSACVLSPGLYVIAGAASQWSATGQARVTGVGVTLFFTCGVPSVPTACLPGADGANIDMGGSSLFQVEAPTSGPLEGLAIVYDRNNNDTMRVVGSGGNAITGTLYAPSATLQLNGNGCVSSMRSMVVVKDLAMFGDPACLTSRYSAANNVALPPNDLHLSR